MRRFSIINVYPCSSVVNIDRVFGRGWIMIREIRDSDAEAFLALCKQLDEENKFMMLEPGERKTTLEEQEGRIREILSKDNQTIFVVEEEEALVGYLAAIGGSYARNRHEAYIVVGIREAFTGRGLGTALFERLEAWAGEHSIHRLELTVMVHNTRGVGLYKKMGFEVEGVKRDSLFVDGKYVDEYYMGKILNPRPGLPPTGGRSVEE
jgi:RimJ/RimL family protein N-acetyltransferase